MPVKGGWWQRFFAKPPPLPEDVRQAVTDLEKLASDRPSLAEPAHLLRAALTVLWAEPVPLPAWELPADRAAAKLAAGMPLFQDESLGLEDPAHQRRWERITAVIGLAPDALDPAEGLRAVLARRPEVVPGGDLAATALRLHWFPLLSALPRPAAEWRQGVCPGCGQGPALAELRGLEQGRFLRCGWCAAGWEVPRQFCPRCGTTDYRHLAYLQIEGEESRRRVAVCHACHGYVKTVNVLTGPPPVGVLVNDVATLDLDLAAAERGFGAPT